MKKHTRKHLPHEKAIIEDLGDKNKSPLREEQNNYQEDPASSKRVLLILYIR